MTRPGLNSEDLEAKGFVHLFPGGFGSYKPKGTVSHRVYCQYLLLHVAERFRQSPLFIFFMIDRYIKTSMINFNHFVVGPAGKNAMEKPTVEKLKDPRSEAYKRYGQRVAANIPGSKSFFFVAQQELLAMSAALGKPKYFVTFTTNDNWPEIQSLLMDGHGPGRYCKDCPHTDQRKPATGNPTYCSIAFHLRFLEWIKVVVQDPNGELGHVIYYWFRREYQQRGAVHIHGVLWICPGCEKCNKKKREPNENPIRAEMPRSNRPEDQDFIKELRELVETFQVHHCVPEKCKMDGKKVLKSCRLGYPQPLVNQTRIDNTGLRKLYRRTKEEDRWIIPFCISMLLIVRACCNIQEITEQGFEQYLTKYICKHEKSARIPHGVHLGNKASVTERYFRLRILGIIEAIDILLQFALIKSNVEIIYLDIPTNSDSIYKVLKRKEHLKEGKPEDVFYQTKFEKYLHRPKELKVCYCNSNSVEFSIF